MRRRACRIFRGASVASTFSAMGVLWARADEANKSAHADATRREWGLQQVILICVLGWILCHSASERAWGASLREGRLSDKVENVGVTIYRAAGAGFVAQIFNLPYRRLAVGRRSDRSHASALPNGWQMKQFPDILIYSTPLYT